jgi:pilus assembly protein CpaC
MKSCMIVLLSAMMCRASLAAPVAIPLAGPAPPVAPAVTAEAASTSSADRLRCRGEAAKPAELQLQLGKSTLMRLPDAVLNRSVGNPGVVQAMLIAPDTLYVVGVDVGSTNMIIQGRNGLCSVIDVTVGMDASGLQASLAALMPEEKAIRVSSAADSLVLSGTVDDASAVSRAVELAQAYVRRPAKALALGGKGNIEGADGLSAGSGAASSAPASASAAPASAGSRIVNMLSVSAPQQVMLEVKIAEVSKSLIDQLSAGALFKYGNGSWATTIAANQTLAEPRMPAVPAVPATATTPAVPAVPALPGEAPRLFDMVKSNGSRFAVDAKKNDGLVRILAEPTVMAISGQEGSFLAGGKFFIPVAQEDNKVSLEEKEFGVGLRFTPTVLAGGRINLKVAPEVSELSREGIGISAAGFTGNTILPVITTRRAQTTVQLFDGQSFAIGGLIKDNQTTNIAGLPILGEVPVLGALFRSTDFQQDRTELLFVVTAHLVKPLPANYVLPTAQVTTPSRARLFLGGRMEGPPPASGAAAGTPVAPTAQGTASGANNATAPGPVFEVK